MSLTSHHQKGISMVLHNEALKGKKEKKREKGMLYILLSRKMEAEVAARGIGNPCISPCSHSGENESKHP